MTVNGIELLAKAGTQLEHLEALAVLVDDFSGIVPLAEARSWLQRMAFHDDWTDPDWNGHPHEPRGSRFALQAWTARLIHRTRIEDGKIVLDTIPRDPADFGLVDFKF